MNQRQNSAVPVMKPLAKTLEKHRAASGDVQVNFIFVSRRDGREGGSINLNSLLEWQIKPKSGEAGIQWRSWHAFRRGLATNLHRLGVPDKTIQAIPRHSNLYTTMNNYVKSVPLDAVAALQAFEAARRQYAPHHRRRKSRSQSVGMEKCTRVQSNFR